MPTIPDLVKRSEARSRHLTDMVARYLNRENASAPGGNEEGAGKASKKNGALVTVTSELIREAELVGQVPEVCTLFVETPIELNLIIPCFLY
jgi:hypothetical protein